MAGGDGGSGKVICTVPAELKEVVILYQNRTRLPTFNAAIRCIIETHPGIAEIITELLYSLDSVPGGTRETE